MGPSPVVRLDDALRGLTRVGLDTSPLIYFIEFHPVFGPVAQEIFRRVSGGMLVGYCSIVTRTETLSHPLRRGDRVQLEAYRDLFLTLRMLDVDETIADRAAELRARYNLRTPDAIHVATAIVAGCEAFLINDLALRRVTGLRVMALSALAL
jgi:predicted nucleic acid-binding protein